MSRSIDDAAVVAAGTFHSELVVDGGGPGPAGGGWCTTEWAMAAADVVADSEGPDSECPFELLLLL